jgi:hypothetical protein
VNALETILYDTSRLFLTPVLLLLCAMFAYAVFAVGALLFDLAVRRRPRAGRPLHRWKQRHPHSNDTALELQVLKRLEPLRITSRVAPMLGLVATMIPMGPALVAVAAGNAQGVRGGDRGAAGGIDDLCRAVDPPALAAGRAEPAAARRACAAGARGAGACGSWARAACAFGACPNGACACLAACSPASSTTTMATTRSCRW